ncbi:prenyltransferase/squalene oxidase repeat-containing protein [Paraliomyxa miuraensis]|uniref:hypothetical protein n=1 Tax=Paraliomyxa miuraensis TaxID=376150 RepID=UPI002254A75A|nr:hypothetical protein [Paraliomyxa miuraensis]MCX4241963.1 hypothetical protein [Paraliomyxa miuraensis]
MPDRPSLAARPRRAALLRWLVSDAVVAPDGRVWSWHNPAHPGYAYPEAGGLWLALLAREPSGGDAPLERVAAWLRGCETPHEIGRDGRGYLFDLAMVVAGRLSWADRCGHQWTDEGPAIAAMLAALRAGRATSGPTHGERWSERFGPHLLKLALPLARWVERTQDPEATAALTELLATLRPHTLEGRVPSEPNDGPGDGPTYLHAHCYAAEGLWRLSEAPVPTPVRMQARELADQAVAWLARVQRADGGLPPWHDGTRGWGPAPADVAAQAVRLWSGLDPARYRGAIDRALAFLGRLGDPSGGLRYHETSDDLNTWATVFTVQALDFAEGRADVRRLV